VRRQIGCQTQSAASERRGLHGVVSVPTATIEFTALVIYRIHVGRIAESWGEIDFLRLPRQLLKADDDRIPNN
jgi:predicted ester cyclase